MPERFGVAYQLTEIEAYMFAWRRFIAALMIMVFAPAAALSATPLKLCIGSDGHRALEAVFTSHHHADPIRVVQQAAAQISQRSINAADCRDVPLIDVQQRAANFSNVVDQPDISKNFVANLLSFPQAFAFVEFCDSRKTARLAGRIEFPNPHLASLATVVLLN